MKHAVGDIWKDGSSKKEPYLVQFPLHIEGARTKKEAERKREIALAVEKKLIQIREEK